MRVCMKNSVSLAPSHPMLQMCEDLSMFGETTCMLWSRHNKQSFAMAGGRPADTLHNPVNGLSVAGSVGDCIR